MFSEVKSAMQKPTRKYTYREVDESEVISALEDLFVIRPQVNIFTNIYSFFSVDK